MSEVVARGGVRVAKMVKNRRRPRLHRQNNWQLGFRDRGWLACQDESKNEGGTKQAIDDDILNER